MLKRTASSAAGGKEMNTAICSSSEPTRKRSGNLQLGAEDVTIHDEQASDETAPFMEPFFEHIPARKFPSLEIDSKRNATKRRKRDKTVPLHAMTTSTILKFQAFHFTPLRRAEFTQEGSSSLPSSDELAVCGIPSDIPSTDRLISLEQLLSIPHTTESQR
jgi:hypothetical protein